MQNYLPRDLCKFRTYCVYLLLRFQHDILKFENYCTNYRKSCLQIYESHCRIQVLFLQYSLISYVYIDRNLAIIFAFEDTFKYHQYLFPVVHENGNTVNGVATCNFRSQSVSSDLIRLWPHLYIQGDVMFPT